MANNEPTTKAVVTVSEMARMVGLSRARFYQLVKEGIFPEPSRWPTTNRPYFDHAQQEQCLTIRKTHCGANRKAVLFYGQVVDRTARPPAKRTAKTGRSSVSRPRNARTKPTGDPLIAKLKHGLGQLGLAATTDAAIRAALANEFADGHNGVDSTELLKAVFRRLNCQNSTDNVAG